MSSIPLFTLQNASLSIGNKIIINDVTFSINKNDRICLVGRNGCGKSTLLKIIAGKQKIDQGKYIIQPGIKIYLLPQEPTITPELSILEEVTQKLPDDHRYKAESLLEDIGLNGEKKCTSLSGGELKKISLIKAFLSDADLLLLDEPTNHLDIKTILWLEDYLLSSKLTLVIISHDRAFLNALTKKIFWLSHGHIKQVEKKFSEFENWKDEQLELEAEQLHKLDRKIAFEQNWKLHGLTARRKRNVRRVEELEKLKENRKDLATQRPNSVKIEISQAKNTSQIIANYKNVHWAWDNSRPLVNNLNLKISKKDRIGICGPNGIGKTTLIKLLMKELSPQEGDIQLSPTLQTVSLSQYQNYDPNQTVSNILTKGHGETVFIGGHEKRHVIGYMKDFLFPPDYATMPIKYLSGGEKRRLALASILAEPSNLMILDEPTNDLDMETLDILEDMLSTYEGTLIIISHDRSFLDHLVDSILFSEGEGKWVNYPGSYSDLLNKKKTLSSSLKSKTPIKNKPHEKQQSSSTMSKNTLSKISYKDERLLKELPSKIEKIEKDILICKKSLEDPNLYVRDPRRFEKITELLNTLQKTLENYEEEWLRIEMLKEDVKAD